MLLERRLFAVHLFHLHQDTRRQFLLWQLGYWGIYQLLDRELGLGHRVQIGRTETMLLEVHMLGTGVKQLSAMHRALINGKSERRLHER